MKRLLCLAIFMASVMSVCAQGLYIKGSVVSVASSTTLSVPDSLVNNGTLVNNGNLRISGAWINNGTYDAGTGEINFNNNLTQTINHKDQSIGKLTISGGGVKQFLANITIRSELTLQSGILVSGNGAKIILNHGAVVSGASNASHVNGPVENKGAGTWLFPTGNGTTYLPVVIANVVDTAAKATISLNELPLSQSLTGDAALSAISTKRYWELVLNGGKIDQSKITLPLANEDGLLAGMSSVVVAGSASATGSYVSLGQSARTGSLSAGSVTSAQPATFRFFTVAAESGERDILVYNALSPNADGKNEVMRIDNIEQYPNNTVLIFNRWGDRVFEMRGYDNAQKNFRGDSSVGGEKLSAGTYYYTIDLGNGSEKRTGYLVIR